MLVAVGLWGLNQHSSSKRPPSSVYQKWSDLPDSLSCCDKSYIGQTGRTLLQRIKEHQRAVKTMNKDNSALAEHAWSEHQHIAWEDATVLDQHPFLHSRCVMESWYINNIPETLNREKGLLPETYLSLLNANLKTISTDHAYRLHGRVTQMSEPEEC